MYVIEVCFARTLRVSGVRRGGLSLGLRVGIFRGSYPVFPHADMSFFGCCGFVLAFLGRFFFALFIIMRCHLFRPTHIRFVTCCIIVVFVLVGAASYLSPYAACLIFRIAACCSAFP